MRSLFAVIALVGSLIIASGASAHPSKKVIAGGASAHPNKKVIVSGASAHPAKKAVRRSVGGMRAVVSTQNGQNHCLNNIPSIAARISNTYPVYLPGSPSHIDDHGYGILHCNDD